MACGAPVSGLGMKQSATSDPGSMSISTRLVWPPVGLAGREHPGVIGVLDQGDIPRRPGCRHPGDDRWFGERNGFVLHQRPALSPASPFGLISCDAEPTPEDQSDGERDVGRSILTIWQWMTTGLVLVGLLLTPVTCSLVDHPHSLFDAPASVQGDDHAGHARALGPLHAMPMINGAPPLVEDVPLPDLDPGAVVSWLTNRDSTAGSLVNVVGEDPGAVALPAVSAAAMTMAASGLNALPVTLLLVLAVALIAIRPLPAVAALLGRALAIIAPPPKRLAPV